MKTGRLLRALPGPLSIHFEGGARPCVVDAPRRARRCELLPCVWLVLAPLPVWRPARWQTSIVRQRDSFSLFVGSPSTCRTHSPRICVGLSSSGIRWTTSLTTKGHMAATRPPPVARASDPGIPPTYQARASSAWASPSSSGSLLTRLRGPASTRLTPACV